VKLVSRELELRVIKTICAVKSQKEAAKLFSSVKVDSFYTKPGKECFNRVVTLLRERGELVGWGELCVDPVISEQARDKLKLFKEKSIPAEKVDRAIQVLDKYRRMRSLLQLSQDIVKSLEQKSIDVEALSDRAAKTLLEARTGANVNSWFVHVGAKDKSDIRLVKKLLQHDARRYIPTGIKAFDDRNQGIPRGSCFLLGGNTGAGKSVMIGQLGHNMSYRGAKVCIVPLEMKNEEMLQRELSRLTEIDMSRLTNQKQLSDMEKEQVLRRYRKFRDRLEKVGATLSLFSPDEDMTAEEILFALKPFGYDVIFIDYVGLLKGVDGDDQWKAMRNVTRFAKRFAAINDMVIAIAAQLSDEGIVRYARGMVEDASNAFFFTATAKSRETGIMWVKQPKARNQIAFDFPIAIDYAKMTIGDISEEQKQMIDEENESKGKSKKGKKKKFGKQKEGKEPSSKKDRLDFDFGQDD
jgi:replicative DNA helicase